MSGFDILTKEDRELFEEVTRQSFKVINKFAFYLKDAKKIVDKPELNKQGLQLARYLYFNRVFDNHLSDTPYAQWYKKDGFVKINNYLSEPQMDKLRKKQVLDVSEQQLIWVREFFRYTKVFRKLERQEHVHYPEDDQYFYHIDTFFPCIKVWYSLDAVLEAKGPLKVSPGSCFPTKRFAQFIYDSSISKGESIKKYGETPKAPGSPRLNRLEQDQEKILVEAGYNPSVSLINEPNTLYVMDCRLFHRRGNAIPGIKREWHIMKARRFI
jgi:hypothetical protein